jgi:hypothetical protein
MPDRNPTKDIRKSYVNCEHFCFCTFFKIFCLSFLTEHFEPLSNKVNLAKKLCECATNPKMLSIFQTVKLIFLLLSIILRLTHIEILKKV